jgi:DNA-binding NtrC family response regulator
MKSRARVLVVDDERLMRRLVRQILIREGYTVVTSPDAAEAIRKLAKSRFDIVITDLRMPDTDGFKLIKDLKSRYPSLSIIVMTGFGDVDTADEVRRHGADEYVTKPFNEREIQVIVERVCWRRMVCKDGAKTRLRSPAEHSALSEMPAQA